MASVRIPTYWVGRATPRGSPRLWGARHSGAVPTVSGPGEMRAGLFPGWKHSPVLVPGVIQGTFGVALHAGKLVDSPNGTQTPMRSSRDPAGPCLPSEGVESALLPQPSCQWLGLPEAASAFLMVRTKALYTLFLGWNDPGFTGLQEISAARVQW